MKSNEDLIQATYNVLREGYGCPLYSYDQLLSAMDAARKDEAEKYYIHARLTKEESEKIRSYKATEVKFISGAIGVSVYCKNEKGKWIDITDYSTW